MFLADIWPSPERSARSSATRSTRSCSAGPTRSSSRATSAGRRCRSRRATATPGTDDSTYIAKPPFFDGLTADAGAGRATSRVPGCSPSSATRSRPTTSRRPARSPPWSPAGQWLQEHGVGAARVQLVRRPARPPRGDDARHVRATSGCATQLVEGREGPYTVHLPDGEEMFIYDAAMRYRDEGVPLIVIAGREYGSGSSRDWAAKGTGAARRPAVHRRELRAHPPLEPGRDGHPAAPVPARRERRVARASPVASASRSAGWRPGFRRASGSASSPERRATAGERRFERDRPPRRPDRRRLLPAGRRSCPRSFAGSRRRAERGRSSSTGWSRQRPRLRAAAARRPHGPAALGRPAREVGKAVVGVDEPLRLSRRAARRRPCRSSRTSRAPARRCSPRASPGPSASPTARVQGTPDLLPSDVTGSSIFEAGRLRFVAGPGLHEHPPGRRDQPGDATDPVGAARGDAGAPGHGRGHDPSAAGPVPRPRDPEPGRVRGHVLAAAGPARPLPAPGPDRLPVGRGRAHGSPAATRPRRSRSTRSGRSPPDAA